MVAVNLKQSAFYFNLFLNLIYFFFFFDRNFDLGIYVILTRYNEFNMLKLLFFFRLLDAFHDSCHFHMWHFKVYINPSRLCKMFMQVNLMQTSFRKKHTFFILSQICNYTSMYIYINTYLYRHITVFATKDIISAKTS